MAQADSRQQQKPMSKEAHDNLESAGSRKQADTPRAPIWHSPAWITGIVGLISAFLTVPEIIGNYITKKQDIELAQQKTEAARLENSESKQEQEFQIVNRTLAQQGPERVFVLRYLAATLDDEDASGWAEAEVQRLDDLAARQEALEAARRDFQKKEKEILDQKDEDNEGASALRTELAELRSHLETKNSELAELRQKAGFPPERSRQEDLLRIQVLPNTTNGAAGGLLFLESDNWRTGCVFVAGSCEFLIAAEPPETIKVEFSGDFKKSSFGSITASVFIQAMPGESFYRRSNLVSYACTNDGENYECKKR